MTNKEAIGQLKWVQKRIGNITYSPESFEAINLAIKALEERPTGEWKREDIEYAIETSACTFHNGKIYYEKEDLMRSMEDLGLFEDEKGGEEE